MSSCPRGLRTARPRPGGGRRRPIRHASFADGAVLARAIGVLHRITRTGHRHDRQRPRQRPHGLGSRTAARLEPESRHHDPHHRDGAEERRLSDALHRKMAPFRAGRHRERGAVGIRIRRGLRHPVRRRAQRGRPRRPRRRRERRRLAATARRRRPAMAVRSQHGEPARHDVLPALLPAGGRARSRRRRAAELRIRPVDQAAGTNGMAHHERGRRRSDAARRRLATRAHPMAAVGQLVSGVAAPHRRIDDRGPRRVGPQWRCGQHRRGPGRRPRRTRRRARTAAKGRDDLPREQPGAVGHRRPPQTRHARNQYRRTDFTHRPGAGPGRPRWNRCRDRPTRRQRPHALLADPAGSLRDALLLTSDAKSSGGQAAGVKYCLRGAR